MAKEYIPRGKKFEMQRLLQKAASYLGRMASRQINVMVVSPKKGCVIDDPSIVVDDVTPRNDITPRNMLRPENITTRRVFNFELVAQTSPSTFVQETMQTIMDQAK
ncbi:hypothetical protein CsSME_00039443 [Camellia sinensis var. sinensis]